MTSFICAFFDRHPSYKDNHVSGGSKTFSGIEGPVSQGHCQPFFSVIQYQGETSHSISCQTAARHKGSMQSTNGDISQRHTPASISPISTCEYLTNVRMSVTTACCPKSCVLYLRTTAEKSQIHLRGASLTNRLSIKPNNDALFVYCAWSVCLLLAGWSPLLPPMFIRTIRSGPGVRMVCQCFPVMVKHALTTWTPPA